MEFKEISREEILKYFYKKKILYREKEMSHEIEKCNMVAWCLLISEDGDYVYLKKDSLEGRWNQRLEIFLDELFCYKWFIESGDE